MTDEKRAALVRELRQAFPGISEAEVEARMQAYDNSLEGVWARYVEAWQPIRNEINRVFSVVETWFKGRTS